MLFFFVGGISDQFFVNFSIHYTPPEKTNLQHKQNEGFGIASGFSIFGFPWPERVMFEDFHVHLPGEIVQIRHQIVVETRPSKIHIVIHTLGKGPLTS